jgi:hypothetical protein
MLESLVTMVCTRLIIFIAPKHENFRDTPGRPLVSKKRGKNLWLPSGYHWYRPTWGTTCRPEPEQAVQYFSASVSLLRSAYNLPIALVVHVGFNASRDRGQVIHL